MDLTGTVETVSRKGHVLTVYRRRKGGVSDRWRCHRCGMWFRKMPTRHQECYPKPFDENEPEPEGFYT